MTTAAVLNRIRQATVRLDPKKVADPTYLADRERRVCEHMLAVVKLVPPLVGERTRLRQERTQASVDHHRSLRPAVAARALVEIDNRLEDVAVVICAATDAVARLNRQLAKVVVLKRKVASRRDCGSR